MNSNQKAAEFLLHHRRASTAIENIPANCYPNSVDDAYAVQDMVVAQLCKQNTSTPCGYKLACTNKPIMDLLGVDGPFSGRLLTHSMHKSGVDLAAESFSRRVVEPEFVFIIGQDVPLTDLIYDATSIKPYIDGFHPCIEIVDHRYANFTSVGGNALIAENAIHGCCILGEPDNDSWKLLNLENQEVTLNVNQSQKETGTGKNVLGSPLNALAWLANHLQNRNRQLAAGDIVTTGTATNVYYAEPGDELCADFGTLGTVSLSFL